MKFILALNSLNSNYLMLMVLAAGVMMVLKGHDAIGGNLVVGSFAILRSTTTTPQVTTPTPKE